MCAVEVCIVNLIFNTTQIVVAGLNFQVVFIDRGSVLCGLFKDKHAYKGSVVIPLLTFVCVLCMSVCKSVWYCQCVLSGVIQEYIRTCGISRNYGSAQNVNRS